VHRKFQAILHQYKKEVFHAQHDRTSLEEMTTEVLVTTQDVMREKFTYHFHKLPDADRAEIINMINNYVREAILPPVVEKILQRQVLQERRTEALQHMLVEVLEVLSKDPVEA
jgi:hypothetical protein